MFKLLQAALTKSQNNDQYLLLKDSSEIGIEDNQYVLGNEKENKLETYIEIYGRENVRDFSNLVEVSGVDNPIFVKIHAYRQRHTITHQTHVKCIVYKTDLTEVPENKLIDSLTNLSFTCQPYNLGGSTTYKSEIPEVYFIECKIGSIRDFRLLLSPQSNFSQKVRFVGCLISELIIESNHSNSLLHTNSIRNCKISCLHQPNENQERFKFENNSIDILVTAARSVELRNLKLRLYHHKNLDKAEIACDNIGIEFEKTQLKYIDKGEYKGYWNTCILLMNMKSLKSENLEIEKYIHFFNSRDLTLKKVLFNFHRGYTNILNPLVLCVATILCSYSILYYSLDHTDNALTLIFYPVDLFKNVLFKDVGLNNTFSIGKTSLIVLEVLFIYSSFCIGAVIKKILGFKISK